MKSQNSLFITLKILSEDLIYPLTTNADNGGVQTSYIEEAISQKETSHYNRLEDTEADLLRNPGGASTRVLPDRPGHLDHEALTSRPLC